MKWLRKIWHSLTQNTNQPEQVQSEYKGFAVEHYPLTNRYYPTYKGQYIKRHYSTGVYELKEPFLFTYADWACTEEGAWTIIDLFREQRFKTNVQVLTR
jgi:GR25 family glycosyltransferase involved in LPS biosynthesis